MSPVARESAPVSPAAPSPAGQRFYLKARAAEMYGALSFVLLCLGGLSAFGFPSTWIFLPLGVATLSLTYWLKLTPVVHMTESSFTFRPGLGARPVVLPLGQLKAVDESEGHLTLTPVPSEVQAPIVVRLDVLERGSELASVVRDAQRRTRDEA